MKLCQECRFHIASAGDPENARCSYGVSLIRSPVTGALIEKREQPYAFCSVLRTTTERSACGAQAKFFQPKNDPIARCIEASYRDMLANAMGEPFTPLDVDPPL